MGNIVNQLKSVIENLGSGFDFAGSAAQTYTVGDGGRATTIDPNANFFESMSLTKKKKNNEIDMLADRQLAIDTAQKISAQRAYRVESAGRQSTIHSAGTLGA